MKTLPSLWDYSSLFHFPTAKAVGYFLPSLRTKKPNSILPSRREKKHLRQDWIRSSTPTTAIDPLCEFPSNPPQHHQHNCPSQLPCPSLAPGFVEAPQHFCGFGVGQSHGFDSVLNTVRHVHSVGERFPSPKSQRRPKVSQFI